MVRVYFGMFKARGRTSVVGTQKEKNLDKRMATKKGRAHAYKVIK